MATETHAALAQWNADASATKPCPRCEGKQYHHGFGEDGHDPDWCSECGGAGFVAAFSEIEQMQRALDAAASVRAPRGIPGMEILRAVAAIELWRDRWPDGRDIFGVGLSPHNVAGLTIEHVRQARAIVAAAERKAASGSLPEGIHPQKSGDNMGQPAELAGIIPPSTDGAPGIFHPQGCAAAPSSPSVQKEDTAPPPAGPSPAEGAWKPGDPRCDNCDTGQDADWTFCPVCGHQTKFDDDYGSEALTPSPQPSPAPAPDVAGLVDSLYRSGTIVRGAVGGERPDKWTQQLWDLCIEAADALTAQAAEIASALSFIRAVGEELVLAGMPAGDRDVILANVRSMRDALAAKEAEIADTVEKWQADARILNGRVRHKCERIAELEAECERLREVLTDLVNEFSYSATLALHAKSSDRTHAKLVRARTALAGKPEEKPAALRAREG